MSWLERLLGKGRPVGGSGNGGAGDRAQYQRNHDAAQGDSMLDPYAVLGVEPGASAEEIHAAYREAAQKFHPDKVSHLGEEFQALAQQKFVEIQEAYEVLKKEKRG
ncbi:MAG: J domain-containing protein [Desulfobacteraceae bacterium]|nr:MAG: J domain-containing protein [Desulfobacteraceae bacterium]